MINFRVDSCHRPDDLKRSFLCIEVLNLSSMKKTIWLYSVILMLLTTVSCSPFIKVYSEEEPGVNLYKYHTFNWLDNMKVRDGNSGPEWLSQRAEEKIRSAVEDRMRRYAMTLCTEKPDLMLHYHVVIKNEVFFIRDWWCDEEIGSQFGRCHRIKPVDYREGTLILDFIDAHTAEREGLINYAVPPEELDGAVQRLTDAIVAKSPVAVATGKGMFYRQLEMGMEDAYTYAAEVMACNMMAEDAQEGIDAFIEKRAPVWKGR